MAARLQSAGAPTEVDVDLDVLRQARSELSPHKTFRLNGHVFTVPSVIPLYMGILLREGKQREALQMWLGDKQEAEFAGTGINDDDLGDLLRGLYGTGPGESSASSKS